MLILTSMPSTQSVATTPIKATHFEVSNGQLDTWVESSNSLNFSPLSRNIISAEKKDIMIIIGINKLPNPIPAIFDEVGISFCGAKNTVTETINAKNATANPANIINGIDFAVVIYSNFNRVKNEAMSAFNPIF